MQMVWAGAESCWKTYGLSFWNTLYLWLYNGGKHIYVCSSINVESFCKKVWRMTSLSLLMMDNTITDDGNFVCITVGTSSALAQSLLLRRLIFWYWSKFFSFKKINHSIPGSSGFFSACLASAWTRADNYPEFYRTWIAFSSWHSNGASSHAQRAWQSTRRHGAPSQRFALTSLGRHYDL